MNRILSLMPIAGATVAVSTAVRIRGKCRQSSDAAAALQLDVERFANESGLLAPR